MNIKYKNLRHDLQETLLEASIKDAMVSLESTCNVDLIPRLEVPLEKGTATYSSILAWIIPWTTVHGVIKSQT